MRRCRCYEECQGPSHTGYIIIHTISIHQFRERSRKTLGGSLSCINQGSLLSRRIQSEDGFGLGNHWTCVDVWVSRIGTGRVRSCKRYFGCHIHVHTLVPRRIQSEDGFGWDNKWTCVDVWASRIGTYRVWNTGLPREKNMYYWLLLFIMKRKSEN